MSKVIASVDRKSLLWFMRQMLFGAYRKRIMMSVSLLVAAAIAEVFGIAAILPVLVLMTDHTSASKSSMVGKLDTFFKLIGGQPPVEVLLLVIVIGISLKAVLGLIGQQSVARGATGLAATLRTDYIQALLSARWNYLIEKPAGAIASVISIDAIRAGGIFTSTVNIIVAIISAIPFTLMALGVSWQLTVGSVVVSCLIMLLFWGTVRETRRHSTTLSQMSRSLVGRLVDSIVSLKPLRAMALQNRVLPVLTAEIRELALSERRQTFSKSVQSLAQEPVIAIVAAIGLYVSVKLLSLSIAEVSFMLVLFQRLVVRIVGVQNQVQIMATSEAAYLHLTEEIVAARAACEKFYGSRMLRLNESIEFRGVTLNYPPRTVFRDLNLLLRAGRIIAVIGPSGAGKTSLVDMIIGLQAPQSGAIYIDGVPLAEADMDAWRSRIGYVPQEFQLLNDTILNNVTTSDPAIGRNQVKRALELAGAWEFTQALPAGVDTRVGERGAMLSGGQRQRIAIARALVRTPDLLILDEATTALDPATEQGICNTLRDIADPLTIIAISHQAAIAAVADAVVRVEHSRVEISETASKLRSAHAAH
jgi:ATP-binding cassette subfamily C protein